MGSSTGHSVNEPLELKRLKTAHRSEEQICLLIGFPKLNPTSGFRPARGYFINYPKLNFQCIAPLSKKKKTNH